MENLSHIERRKLEKKQFLFKIQTLVSGALFFVFLGLCFIGAIYCGITDKGYKLWILSMIFMSLFFFIAMFSRNKHDEFEGKLTDRLELPKRKFLKD